MYTTENKRDGDMNTPINLAFYGDFQALEEHSGGCVVIVE